MNGCKVPPMVDRSRCQRDHCPYPAHVILYAAGGEFDGYTYRRGHPLAYCLKHGGEIYDAIHERAVASWLMNIARHRELPTVWADHHIRPHVNHPPWRREPRTPLPDRQRTRRAA